MKKIKLEVPIKQDDYTEQASQMFDIEILDKSTTIISDNLKLPDDWNVGVIYGPSGGGKSTILNNHFGKEKTIKWDDRPIISNLDSVSPSEATRILSAVGLSTVPAWLRPYHCLSVGEQFRAKLARLIADSKDEEVIVIDEFTSNVDRNVAKAASCAFGKYIKRMNKKAVVATCHTDILEWLAADWGYSPIEGETHNNGGRWVRPDIELKIFRGKYDSWKLFSPHHYLTASMNKSSRVYLAYWNGVLVGLISILRFPHGHIKNGWRISRVVVLPDYQGLSIGTKFTEFIASCICSGQDDDGNYGRCYIRTTHPAMISSFTRSGNWREAAGSRRRGDESKSGRSTMSGNKNWTVDKKVRHSFEYTGPKTDEEHYKLFWQN